MFITMPSGLSTVRMRSSTVHIRSLLLANLLLHIDNQ
jgi:hypothetical protein